MSMDEKEELILSLKTMLPMLFLLATLCGWQVVQASTTAAENENPDFITIDCGAPEDYYNNELSLSYKVDKEYIDTGVNKKISMKLSNGDNKAGQDLRSFPNGRRNCYTLNPSAGRNNKYLIRAYFLYGNYDGKNKAPSFDIYLANDKWTTVDEPDPSNHRYYEIIYVPKSDYVDVCLHNTGSGIPFISALELRRLEDSSIYDINAGWLFVRRRLNIGALTYLRYPHDIYDRIWERGDGTIVNSGWRVLNLSSISSKIKSNKYQLPINIWSCAATSESATTPLGLNLIISNTTAQYVFYLHFAEIQQIQEEQKRKLKIYLNNVFGHSVELDYLNTLTYTITKPALEGENNLSISNADNTSLPPFLNAVEIFELITINSSSTAPDDVSAVKGIKKGYNLTIESWQGDPCTPTEFLWDGLNCSYNDPIRVVSVNLKWRSLKGEIHPLFGTLSELESLDLSNNELIGQIPEFLASLPKLSYLNLTGNNNISGPIPRAIIDMSTRGSLQLGLPSHCKSDVCPLIATEEKAKPKKKFVVLVVASIISVLVLFLFIVAIFWKTKRRKHGVPMDRSSREEPLTSKGRQFSYSEVVSITNNFNNQIGEGGFGYVYRGSLNDETQVAVKMLSQSSKQGYKEFQAEAKILLSVNHKKLVSLLGYFDEDDHKGFIYEHMAKGNLHKVLSETEPNILNWRQRLQIAVDSAQGLEYLHSGCQPSITHRDMKTSNILLDENFRAKIADFGLSKPFKSDMETLITTTSAGTLGYLDPEYHKTGTLTDKSDVYSFGIILLVLITGRSAMTNDDDLDKRNIVRWISPLVEKGDIRNIVDKRLQGKFEHRSARKAIEVALSCVQETATDRPDMSRVLVDLNECLNMEMTVPVRTSMELGDSMAGHSEIRSPNT